MIKPLTPRKSRHLVLALLATLCVSIAPVHGSAAAVSTLQDANGFVYVLFASDSTSVTMSGSTDDIRRARSLRAGREALLYVRDGGRAYLVRDPATLRRAELIFAPQQALGARQAELGARQAALGARQAGLGAQQARLGGLQADAAPRRAVALGRQQHELGRQQDLLGREQNVLGDQQAALGREQSRLARRAETQFRALIADAIQRGVARRLD